MPTGEVELLALRAVAPRAERRAERRGVVVVKVASLTTAKPPALRGLVLSQRDKTHQGRDGFHAVPDQTSGRTKEPMGFLANAVMCGMAICLRLDLNPLRGLISDRSLPGWDGAGSSQRDKTHHLVPATFNRTPG